MPKRRSETDARNFAEPTPVGSRLRDAAVDPHKDDFLAPINAGKADPHGPLVVSPQIHASDTGPIVPGDVHVDDPAVQEKREKEVDTAVLIEGQSVPSATSDAAG